MGYLRRPYYYKNFKCISSACTDSCCQEWEIDIDDDTLEYYRQVEGEFGKRLKDNIKLPGDGEDIETAHFIQTESERCPFLNDCNLCDIFVNLGEEHLSYICTHHPRYYDWFIEGQEAGLGLCCEEAARLILEESGYPEFDVTDDNAEAASVIDEDLLFEKNIEQMLFEMREELFGIIKSGEAVSIDEKMDRLYKKALAFQNQYDDMMFPEEGELEDSGTENDKYDCKKMSEKNDNCEEFPKDTSGRTFSEIFWTEAFIKELFEFYLELEINDVGWWKFLSEIKEHVPEILENRKAFFQYYEEKLYEYEQLLVYFIYRHFMKSRIDTALYEKVIFALISASVIQILDIYEWLKSGKLETVSQIDICKLYSKEIEYDEENMESVSLYFSAV